MKIKWQESDIKCGTRLYTVSSDETWIIGYIVHEEQGTLYTLISLIDGMVQIPTSKNDLVVRLNKGHYIPVAMKGALNAQ